MPKLTIRRGNEQTEYTFCGTPPLAEALAAASFVLPLPCGGRGTCGKCAVPALTGEVSPPNDAETRMGTRLMCQAVLLGDCAVTLPETQTWVGIETAAAPALGNPMPGRYGAAIDLGTTTIATQLYDLRSGQLLSQDARVNPQTAVAADVMGRISAALAGGPPQLSALATEALRASVRAACATAGVAGMDALTIAGNTTMLYLLTGRDPRMLATAPFEPDTRFGVETPLLGATAYLPPCAGAFMGADLTCAALATELCEQTETTLLMDIGTNGELMLWHNGKLYTASVPAGPAFEGGEISQGVGGVTGAIDKVWLENGRLGSRVIGGGEAKGLCGSGLIDAVAALLRLGHIDASGASDVPAFTIRNGVRLTAGDVRAVQLAKAATAAAVETLLSVAGIPASAIRQLWLAGGFGSHLSIPSAVAIGLIPAALAGKARAVGNVALAGAAALLLDTPLRKKAEAIARQAQVIPLGGDEGFEKRFLNAMDFPHAM